MRPKKFALSTRCGVVFFVVCVGGCEHIFDGSVSLPDPVLRAATSYVLLHLLISISCYQQFAETHTAPTHF